MKQPIDTLVQNLPDDALIPLPAVTTLIGMSRTWLYGAITNGDFPRPRKIGRASRWRLGEVRRWLAECGPETPMSPTGSV